MKQVQVQHRNCPSLAESTSLDSQFFLNWIDCLIGPVVPGHELHFEFENVSYASLDCSLFGSLESGKSMCLLRIAIH